MYRKVFNSVQAQTFANPIIESIINRFRLISNSSLIAICFLVSLNSLFCISCKSGINQRAESSDFTMNTVQEGFKKDDFGQIIYVYKGSLRNNTSNIYKQVKINMRVIINLENGQQLTDQSINDDNKLAFFSGLESLHIEDMVEPGKDYEMKEFESAQIDPKYADYPVKSVLIQFTAGTNDEINNTSTEDILIKNEDVTDKWKEIMSNTDQKNISIDTNRH